jgi:hypothetical protein
LFISVTAPEVGPRPPAAAVSKAILVAIAILPAHWYRLILMQPLHLPGETEMSEPQLSVRSARARELAHRLARRERRTVAEVVERALEAYESAQTGREPAAQFYARLAAEFGTDIDLEAVIKADRAPHPGPVL